MRDSERARSRQLMHLLQEQFGRVAGDYLDCPIQGNDFTIGRLLDLANPSPDWVALDVATGAGHMTCALAARVSTVLTIDPTREMLDAARSLAHTRRQTNIRFEVGEASRIPAEDGTFDFVTCRLAVHHFLDVDAFVAEARRVLKDDGLLGIVDSHLPENAALDEINEIQRIHDPSHRACWTRPALEEVLAAHGFASEAVEEGRVRLGFRSWTRRKRLGPATVDRIRRLMLHEAHPDTVNLLDVASDDEEEFRFSFQRIILLARKMRHKS